MKEIVVGSGLFKATVEAAKWVGQLDAPADSKMRDFFVRNKHLGRRDRYWIAETVFDILRNRRRYSHYHSSLGGPVDRALVLASMVERRQFFGEIEGYIKPLELTVRDVEWLRNVMGSGALVSTGNARANPLLAVPLKAQVRFSVPDWAYQLLEEQYGPEEASELAAAALRPAPLDLRVNTLKADPDSVIAGLTAAQIPVEVIPWLSSGLRVQGKPALDKTDAFNQGWFEVQDAGSQWLSQVVGAKRGQTVVDFCAGAGGKTLAMAAQMRNTGQIYAVDVSAVRLQRMRPRLARAGVTNVQPMLIDSELDPKLKRLRARADRVLVDAPCSGSGTWRRNPDLKWRQKEAGMASLQEQQLAILKAAAQLVRPGGVLLYSTCSLFDRENGQIIQRFLNDPEFVGLFDATEPKLPIPNADTNPDGSAVQLLPHRLDSDGFFVQALTRVNKKD